MRFLESRNPTEHFPTRGLHSRLLTISEALWWNDLRSTFLSESRVVCVKAVFRLCVPSLQLSLQASNGSVQLGRFPPVYNGSQLLSINPFVRLLGRRPVLSVCRATAGEGAGLWRLLGGTASLLGLPEWRETGHRQGRHGPRFDVRSDGGVSLSHPWEVGG